MVQTYGTVTQQQSHLDHEVDPSVADESSTLLGGPVTKALPDGHATIFSSISNLLNTIVGSGMLTFPLAFASAGIVPGMLTCVFSGAVASFGLYLLSLCATKTSHRRASFHAVSQLTFPGAAIFFDAAIAVKCFGVSISYLIIIKALMPNVVASIFHDLTSPDTNPPDWALNGRVWLMLFMLILAPLSFLRHLNNLRHTSYIALFSIAYLIIIVITCYFWPLKGMPSSGEVRWIHFTPGFVSTFPVQVFAFTCSQNLFPIYNELKSNTQGRMNTIIGGSIGTATLTYLIIAVFGYLTFGSQVEANIIAMYPSTSLFIAIGQLAIVILVMFSYPLQVHPCRHCLDKVFHPEHLAEAIKATEAEAENDEVELGGDEHGHHQGLSPFKHFVFTTCIVATGFLTAYFVNDLQLVLSFVGATGSTSISFILPGLFFWKLTKNDPNTSKTMNWSALALMIYGMCVCVFCLSFNVYGLFQGKPTAH
ncbi:transmembrane amino acid transporter protein-domain-containing protein [Crepidotus variabilis]|uniref:Transmembrane amino acid transporter protein-domain-containing protein n=1 Tax=Crepidotus variabilis TaxID=179855 RepID=A0A9P6E9P5_9AGAR|nr:transmembrane amino acid transporter protein-domain-containing protein [Crepidotus variabilis]